ncbi:MAG: hypothetical protein EHM12_01515 [Dehalococcoidia bacterium]|nr:MAG: hypothetical protein EHM12_01515 [Dehalococcoidia bacterium]
MSICKDCWVAVKSYHKISTEKLLIRYNDFIAFNTTSSRWGFVSIFSTLFSFAIALSIAFFALQVSLYGLNGNKMTWYIWMIVVFAILAFIIGLGGMLVITWISLYFLRVPLKDDAPVLTSINKSVSEDIPAELRNINKSLNNVNQKIGQENMHHQ